LLLKLFMNSRQSISDLSAAILITTGSMPQRYVNHNATH
jgi:hypothetical protein